MPPDRRTFLRNTAVGLSAFLPACRPAPRAAPQETAEAAERALRIELRHTISASEERFLPTRLRAEPHWAGPDRPPETAPDWGDYRLDVTEPGTGKLLYRVGFDTSATADSAAAISARIPHPEALVDVSIAKRRVTAVFQPLWYASIDPADPSIDRSRSSAETRVRNLQETGAPADKVDVAILGDGYLGSEYPKFLDDAERASSDLFSVEPFRTRRADFNVRAVFTPSPASGVTDPYLELRRSTAYACAYGSGIAERTLSVGNESALREAASSVPYDYLLVLANSRRYGGSSYLGGAAVVSIDSAAARYLVLHEFAHAFAGLADEYYIPAGDGPAYAGNVEPWNPNVTRSPAAGKWRGRGTQRWNKREYDRYFADYVRRYLSLRAQHAAEDRVERFMQAESRRQAALLANNPSTVGFFEGANGFARGMFRAGADCIMFSLQTKRFCAACAAAIERAIDYHSR